MIFELWMLQKGEKSAPGGRFFIGVPKRVGQLSVFHPPKNSEMPFDPFGSINLQAFFGQL